MGKSKEVYDLEDCISKNLKKMLYRIPEFTVSDLKDRYVITIKPDNMDMKTIGSAAAIKRWVKQCGVPFSTMKCGKQQHDRLGNELWCEVYKKVEEGTKMKVVEAVIDEAGNRQIQKQCDLLLKMIGEVNKGVKNKISQIRSLDASGETHKVTAGDLDDIREDLDRFISNVMNLKV